MEVKQSNYHISKDYGYYKRLNENQQPYEMFEKILFDGKDEDESIYFDQKPTQQQKIK